VVSEGGLSISWIPATGLKPPGKDGAPGPRGFQFHESRQRDWNHLRKYVLLTHCSLSISWIPATGLKPLATPTGRRRIRSFQFHESRQRDWNFHPLDETRLLCPFNFMNPGNGIETLK